MLQGFNADKHNAGDFRQRVADQNIQSIDDRQDELQQAKNGFIGMLAGIVVGGIVGWIFLGQTTDLNKQKAIPVIRRPLIPAKVQPYDPGGMEIDNQDREIYHIVDNTERPVTEVNIQPLPEMPKIVTEKNIAPSENIDSLLESVQEDETLADIATGFEEDEKNKVILADSNLEPIKTNSNEKVIIPQKIKEIDVDIQKSVTPASGVSSAKKTSSVKTESAAPIKVVRQSSVAKGTWYTQIIASSSRASVENLWRTLSKKHSFLKNYTYEIEEISTAAGSTLYRLKVGSFKTRAEAVSLSEKLKKNQISSIIKQN